MATAEEGDGTTMPEGDMDPAAAAMADIEAALADAQAA